MVRIDKYCDWIKVATGTVRCINPMDVAKHMRIKQCFSLLKDYRMAMLKVKCPPRDAELDGCKVRPALASNFDNMDSDSHEDPLAFLDRQETPSPLDYY
ncbi:hypothetical protein DdX_17863 [Ditylenchus destructor]|uniref:Uncharacterized protein n=1 Tax=Ditylenchus destructor TaxID=166010 RepID=A0AAD4MLP8_9BILA|nr:hypothetical protein DdX_17863 [Ditylenchus destructor]